MKPIPFVALLIMTVYSNSLRAQSSYKLLKPSLQGNKQELLFRFITAVKPVNVDTTEKVIHIYSDNQKIASYKLLVIADSLAITYTQTDRSMYNDSLFKQLTTSDTTQEALPYRVLLVATTDINMEYPIEDVFVNTPVKKKDAPISTDTTSVKKDSLTLKNKISIHGSITAIGQLSDNTYNGQTIPQNYLRSYINSNVDVFGVPFNVGYLYTTESNTNLNRINNFRFSFDYQTFHQNLKNKLEKKIKTEKDTRLNKIAAIDIKEINKEFDKLNIQLTNPDYLADLSKSQKILEKASTDSLFMNSYRYKRAAERIKKHDLAFSRINEIKKLKADFLKQESDLDLKAKRKKIQLDKPEVFKSTLKKFGLYKGSYDFFLSIKKLDFGTFDPNYSTLVLSGVSLTGINAELNPGNFYGAFVWGQTVSNFNNPFSYNIGGGRTIMAGRVGVGRTEKMLFAITVLKGEDKSGNQVNDSNYNYYSPQNNYVIGTSLTYKLTDVADVELEYASTQNQELDQNNKASESYSSILKKNRKNLSNAWSAKLNVNLKESNTKFYLMTRSVDPYYYSFGTPFLRKDNWRVEAKAEQGFYKKQLTTSVTYRHDEDNIYDLKENSSQNNTFIYNLQLRIKKYPFLILTYAPSYQSFFSSVNKIHIKNTVNMYSATAGYTRLSKKLISTTVFTYLKQYNSSSSTEISLFNVDQYSASENILVKAIDVNFNTSISYILPQNIKDTGEVFIADASVGATILKKKVNITGGYAYQKDFAFELRNIIYLTTGFTLGKSIKVNLRVERHFIHNYTDSISKDNMNLGRITVTKYF